ncbi:MAG: methyltransferase [Cyclobacteriaceae bacterium]|nr:methyltransferase [Cyclobacteriaceae bacterium]
MGIFRFKQFNVNDDGSSMKVGTDAVLLGAWCDTGSSKKILDIGTGTGIIALILAQRSVPEAHIDAVELLPNEAAQARQNVQGSPWPEKINVIQTGIQHHKPTELYDMIVCNPPYFVKSLQPPDAGRATVRHTNTLTHIDLIHAVAHMMNPKGNFHLILPTREAGHFIEAAKEAGLFLTRLTRFYSRNGKPQQRSLMTFGAQQVLLQEDSLYLYGPDRRKSEAYITLTSDFYL